MIPLSDYKIKKSGKPFYENYSGCMVRSNNKIICLYFEKGHRLPPKNEKFRIHTLTKKFPNQILKLKCLSFSDCCYTVASDIEKNLHLIKNRTDMEPSAKNIEVIFDGEFNTLTFDDRIIRFYFHSCHEEDNQLKYQAFMGMGNHCVLPVNIYDFESKLKEATKIFHELLELPPENAGADIKINRKKILLSIEEILDTCSRPSRTAVKKLLLQLLANLAENMLCKNEDTFLKDNKYLFSRIFYKIIEKEKQDLVIKASEFLTRVESCCSLSPQVITDLQIHVRKFILDRKGYSNKSGKLKELVEYNDKAGNLVDAVVYRGILCERQHDPVCHIDFNDISEEITRSVPIHSNHEFIISTSRGNLFFVEPEKRKRIKIFQYINRRESFRDNAKITNIYIGNKKVYLLVQENRLLSIDKHILLNSHEKDNTLSSYDVDKKIFPGTDNTTYGMAVCRMPHHNRQEDECLVGTNQGELFHVDATGGLRPIYCDNLETAVTLDLRAFRSHGRFFVAAAYRNGIIRFFEYFPGRNGKDKLLYLKKIRVDVHAANRLFVFDDLDNYQDSPLIVVGTDSGR